jgi:hypothetical protein
MNKDIPLPEIPGVKFPKGTIVVKKASFEVVHDENGRHFMMETITNGVTESTKIVDLEKKQQEITRMLQASRERGGE